MKNWILTFSCLFLFSCGGDRKIVYHDMNEVERTSVEFGSTDLQRIADTMTNSMLNFGPLKKITLENRPVVFVNKIENRTMEHIDLESVTDTIRSKLIQSQKFRFVDMSQTDNIHKQLSYQSQTNVINQSTAKSFGGQIGADYMLYGSISSIEKYSGRVKDVYYKFTLNLLEVETGILEWSDEKQIRKTGKRRVIGR